MNYRFYSEALAAKLEAPFVHVLFGARQTGKSTLLRHLIPNPDLSLDFSDPGLRSDYLVRPGRLVEECRALPRRGVPSRVVIDEAQAVPAIFDAVQHLFDRERDRYRFVLCGSSARKLRVAGANLLPGRSFRHHLYPLVAAERPFPESSPDGGFASPLPFPPAASSALPPFPACGLVERLAYGELPGVALADERHRPDLLRAYAVAFLEEELRREALVRDWPAFANFLRFAALESGRILNYAAVAREAGVSIPTVKSHYGLLEDMFLGFTVPAWSGSPRKGALSTARFLFFDLGVRHAAAGLKPCPETALADPGPLLEQWVGVELWKRLMYLGDGRLHHYRTKDGAEVDYVIERGGRLTPVEVKWTERPTRADARHLGSFLRDHAGRADLGYVVCRCPRPMELSPGILALPWFMV